MGMVWIVLIVVACIVVFEYFNWNKNKKKSFDGQCNRGGLTEEYFKRLTQKDLRQDYADCSESAIRIIKRIENLHFESLKKIENIALNGKITPFEVKALLAFAISAFVIARAYIKCFDRTPQTRINDVGDEKLHTAYHYLCMVELFEFFNRIKVKKELLQHIDVSEEIMTKDFCYAFSCDIKEYGLLAEYFEKIKVEMGGDQRDLWFKQAIRFGNILINYGTDISQYYDYNNFQEMDILSFTTMSMRIESAKIFDQMLID